jgi:hypothetical protein
VHQEIEPETYSPSLNFQIADNPLPVRPIHLRIRLLLEIPAATGNATLFVRRQVLPPLVEEVFEEDHVARRPLPFRRVGGNLLAIGRDVDNREESPDPDFGFPGDYCGRRNRPP